MKKFLTLLLLFIAYNGYSVSKYVTSTDTSIIINNGVVKRILDLRDNSFVTSSLTLANSGREYLKKESKEFLFLLNDKKVDGLNRWKFNKKEVNQLEDGGEEVYIYLDDIKKEISLKVTFAVYPDLPVIRKKIEVTNLQAKEIKLESFDVEHVKFNWSVNESLIYHNYARMKTYGAYVGNEFDPALIAHAYSSEIGLVVGNEAPGILKRTSICDEDIYDIQAGLTHIDEKYGFREWLNKDEKWESPWVFLVPYKDKKDPYEVIDSEVNDFVRRYMGIRLAKIGRIPVMVYNSYVPFYGSETHETISSLIPNAKKCAIEEFTIDAGWYGTRKKSGDSNWMFNCGDYIIDPIKYPNGFKPLFDEMKAAKISPGLWLSLATAAEHSDVYQQHKDDWFIKDEAGKSLNLHSYDEGIYTACITTGWYDHIFNSIKNLTVEHGLKYAKLDLAVICSAYRFDKETISGCYAKNHKEHKDRNESFLKIFDKTYQLFDELHKVDNDLFIDCTFETMGQYLLIDYSTVKHAEGNWLSNYGGERNQFGLLIRHTAWWRTPMIPASSLVIGNAEMDSPNGIYWLKCLAGTFPIMLGNLNNITDENRAKFVSLVGHFRRMQDKHNYMLYRQDLPGFREPLEGSWDGWQRINNDTKSGGMIGVFRHGSIDDKKIVRINYLDEKSKYAVKDLESDEVVITKSGKELKEEGFVISVPDKYEGRLFEVYKI